MEASLYSPAITMTRRVASFRYVAIDRFHIKHNINGCQCAEKILLYLVQWYRGILCFATYLYRYSYNHMSHLNNHNNDIQVHDCVPWYAYLHLHMSTIFTCIAVDQSASGNASYYWLLIRTQINVRFSKYSTEEENISKNYRTLCTLP